MQTEKVRVTALLLWTAAAHCVHFLLNPFPCRDALTYLHALRFWNETGSYAQVLETFPKFGLLLFSFLPLKWADKAGIPLYPASVVWMILLSIVSVWAFYEIVFLLSDDSRKAMWAGALLAVQPLLLRYAGNLLRDTPYLTFCLLLILCFIRSIRTKKPLFFLFCGITLALTLLSRFEAWELVVLFPVFSIFYLVKKDFSSKNVLAYIALVLTGFGMTTALALLTVGDLPVLYAKGSFMVNSFLPDWMMG